MTWIDDRIAERKERQQNNNLIIAGAETLFTSLWEEIVSEVEEAKQKGFLLTTNGSTFEKEIRMGSVAPPARTSTLRISLKTDKHLVEVHYDRAEDIAFTLDVSKDNVVCLKKDGQQELLHDVAREILDPFLFPVT